MRNVQKARLSSLAVCGALIAVAAASNSSAADAVWLGTGKQAPVASAGQGGKPVAEDPFFRSADAKTLQRMRDQRRLTQAADVVRWEVERSGAAGFTSLRLEDKAAVLRWKGAVPARIQKAIHQAWRHAPVRVESAQYSRAELRAAARRLSQSVEANAASPFHSVVIVDDRAISLVAHPGAAKAGVALDRAQAALPQVSVPVQVAEGAAPNFMTRLNDSAPWWGGARIEAWRNGSRRSQCTSGFGVRDGSGREYILTAAHCATYPDRVQDPTGEYVGGVSREDWGLDLLLVGTDAQHRIYDGGVGSGEFSKAVSGWGWVYPGEWLCQSGSFSGAVCGIQASSNFTYSACIIDSDGDRTCVRDLIQAWKRDGGVAGRPGDSGGPVFSLNGDRVVAKGTITGGDLGSMLLFQDFGTAYSVWGVTPLTGY